MVPVLDLVFGSAVEARFETLPLFAFILDQFEDKQVLFDCPVLFIDFWPEMVEVVLSNLFGGSFYVRLFLLENY